MVVVARELIGAQLRHGQVWLRITETEAYREDETACHASKGRTARNAPLFGPPARWYVYLCYGIHRLINVVTNEDGHAAAVLIRAAECVRGEAIVMKRRGREPGASSRGLLDGPGKVGEAIAARLDMSESRANGARGMRIVSGTTAETLLAGPRVGIDYALPAHRDLPWRFADAASHSVSHKSTLEPLA